VNEVDDKLRRGIAALRAGRKKEARQLLMQVLQQDEENEQAWLWMSGAVETDKLRQFCLAKVLEIDPDNEAAKKGLSRLTSVGPMSPQAEDGLPQPKDEPEDEAVHSPQPVEAAPAAPPDTESTPGGAVRPPASAYHFSVRPSLVPVLVVGIMAAAFFAALIGTFNARIGGGPVIVGLTNFILVVMAAVVGIRVLFALLRRLFTRYTLGSEHLLVERGILTRSRKMIPIHRIQDVATRQSLIERPFGIGDVVVESAGELGGAVLYDLPRCAQYTNTILRAVEERREND
jgi:membrane protein YdbS with pleckstrin-like domain